MEVGFRHFIEGTPTLDAAAARYITNHIKYFAGSSPVAHSFGQPQSRCRKVRTCRSGRLTCSGSKLGLLSELVA